MGTVPFLANSPEVAPASAGSSRRQHDALDFDFDPLAELCAAHGAGGRVVGKEFAKDPVHVLEFQHIVVEDVDFHDLVERGAIGRQQIA